MEEVACKKRVRVDSDELGIDSPEPDLGYLLEASDDELGLPPATASPPAEEAEKPELIRVSSDSAELTGDLWGLDDHIASYDSYEFGIVDSENYNINGGEYAALDGLFDHSDLAYGSGDYLWRPETLPAN
nr:uncharacterized protein LOC109160824 [Ipomoea batatas]